MTTPETATTRKWIASYFEDRVADTVTVIDHPTVPDDPADHVTAILVILRDTIEPAPVAGNYEETHQLWVLDPHVDRETSESMLDRTTDDVLALLEAAPAQMKFVRAERDTFADKYPAYRFTVTITSRTITE